MTDQQKIRLIRIIVKLVLILSVIILIIIPSFITLITQSMIVLIIIFFSKKQIKRIYNNLSKKRWEKDKHKNLIHP